MAVEIAQVELHDVVHGHHLRNTQDQIRAALGFVEHNAIGRIDLISVDANAGCPGGVLVFCSASGYQRHPSRDVVVFSGVTHAQRDGAIGQVMRQRSINGTAEIFHPRQGFCVISRRCARDAVGDQGARHGPFCIDRHHDAAGRCFHSNTVVKSRGS